MSNASPQTHSFNGKVAVVTGGAEGIGRASALAFARAGARVVVADIAAEAGEETARLITAGGGEALFVPTDVVDAKQVDALVRAAVKRFGRLDFAHNNAGVEGRRARTARCTEENWDRTIGVNLKGVWLCMKYELAAMLRQGGGAIVNTASIAGLVGVAKCPAYVASKHGVVGLTKTAAVEYASTGIRINAVCPGMIDTKMLDRLVSGKKAEQAGPGWFGTLRRMVKSVERQAIRAHLKRSAPAGRLGTPEEIAGAVLWLCSDAATFVNGHSLAVDGGYLAQ